MIIVTGASGHLGRLVVDQLASRIDPATVVAAARTPSKLADLAERGVVVRQLDYERPETAASALDGATQVLLISGSEIGRRVAQHRTVIDAAVAAGVEHMAYTSVLRASTTTLGLAAEHKATEAALEDSGLTASLLRHGWYIENYTENLAPALAAGALIGSAGDGRIAAATRADYAAADTAVLLDRERWGRTYELGGTAFTMSELAAAVSAASGRDIGYVDLSPEEHRAALVGAGLPEPVADFLVDADAGIAAGQLDTDPVVLEALIGRGSTPLLVALSPVAAG